MKSLFWAGLTAAAMAAASVGPAAAQYYYPSPYDAPPPPPPPPYYPPPPPGYYPPPPPPGYYPRPPRRELSYACWTKRIQCEMDRPAPVGESCRCFVPGFGYDGGAVIR